MLTDLTFATHELGTLRLADASLGQTSQEPSASVLVEPEAIQPDETTSRTPGISVILGLAIFVFFLLRVFDALRENERVTKRGTTIRICQAAPCFSCRFFSRNIYVKCAVRPSDVLTERAIHCSDYCPSDQEQANQPRILPKQD